MLVIEHIAKLFLLLVALFVVHASAAPRADVSPALDNRNLVTNAARLRAGLGPLKPRSLYSPSRVGARSPTKSVVPVGGTIKVVRKSNRAEVGYVSKNAGSTGFGINTSPSDKLSVTFTPTSSPFNIAITGNNYPYLGFAGGNLGYLDSFNMVATNPTNPGSTSQNVGNSASGQSQSAIWSYNSQTKALTAQWVNLLGIRPDTYFWYYPSTKKIEIIRSPILQSSGYEVLLYVA